MSLRITAKRLIVGTPWEGPVKRLHYLLTRTKNSLYDVQTIEIMRRILKPESVAVDVGAAEGNMLRHIHRFAPDARHFAFEPIPELGERLRARFPECRVVTAALGAAPGVETFRQVIEAPAMSGLRRRVDLPATTPLREYSVRVETLDRAIPAEAAIAFVKIDVEGAELGVFQGGRETLRRCRPVIVFEHGLGGADTYGTEPGTLFDFVTGELGLRLFLLGAWLDGLAPLTRAQFVREFEQSLNYYFLAAA